MPKATITKLHLFDQSHITISKKVSSSGTIHVYYNGECLYLETDTQICLSGAQIQSTFATVVVIPSPDLRKVLVNMTEVLEKIADRKGEELGGITEVSQLMSEDGMFKLYLPVLPNGELRTAVFDRDGDRVENPVNLLSNQFTGKYLISFREVYRNKVDKLSWKIDVAQIRVLESSKLPPGCLIVDTEEELDKVLGKRKTETVDDDAVGFEVTEEELGQNELID